MNTENYTLITGSSGYLGNKILNELLKKKIKIIAAYNKKKLNNKKKTISLKIDLEKFNLKKIKKYKIGNLIHLAWPNLESFTDSTHQSKILNYQKKFIEKIIKNGCKNIIIAGTCYEYGLIDGKISEKHKTKPICSYGNGKDLLRKYLFKLKKKYKFKLTWFRIFFVYGINSSRNNLTNLLINSKKNKQTIILNKKIQRDYVDVDFVSEVFVKVLLNNRDYGIVNLCSGKKIYLKDLVKILKLKYNIQPITKYENSKQRDFEPESFYGCNKRLKKILNN